MATDNYTNPTSIRPDYAWKPTGFLAGMNYSQDRQRYEDTSSLQDYMMKNDATMSGARLQDYFSDAPVREAKRGSDIATSNATKDTIGGIKQQELRKDTLANDLASGTFKSKVSQAVSEAAIKEGDAATKKFETLGQIGGMLSKAADGGPASLAAVMQHLKASGADPSILSFFSNMTDPKQIKNTVKAINDGLLEASEKHQSHLQGIAAQNAMHERVAKIQAQAAKEVAEIRQKGKNKDAEQTLQSLVGKQPEAIRPAARMIMDDPEVDVKTRVKAETMYKEATDQINARAKGRPGDIPGLPPTTYSTLPGGSNQSSGKMTPEGYEILSTNPDGSMKIRDPKTGRTGTYKP